VDNAANRKLNRVGKSWGKESSKKAAGGTKSAPTPKSALKSTEDYTDEQLRLGAKNWAKVQGVKIKGIQNLSRKGLLTLFEKEKVSMDFLKFKIKKKVQYTSSFAGGGQKTIMAPGNEAGWVLDK